MSQTLNCSNRSHVNVDDFRRIWVLYISQFNPELHSQGRLMYGPEPRGEVVATYGFLLLPDLPICLRMWQQWRFTGDIW